LLKKISNKLKNIREEVNGIIEKVDKNYIKRIQARYQEKLNCVVRIKIYLEKFTFK